MNSNKPKIGLSKVVIALLVVLAPDYSYAHGGGLNSEGCHNNRKTGDYHCHRGSQAKSPIKSNIEKSSSRPLMPDSSVVIEAYDRDLYGFKSYPTTTKRGFYTGIRCNTNVDHVVSLKDAHVSGAGRWAASERIQFANDRLNHVPSCSNINSSKSASTPSDFLRKSSDGRGAEYTIQSLCAYLGIYYQVKRKYLLSFSNNDPELFRTCGLEIAE